MTLVEVMVSTLIVIPALYGMMQLIPNIITANRKAEEITKAAYLAEKKMEELKVSAKAPGGWKDYKTTIPGTFPPPDSQYIYTVDDNTPGGGTVGPLKDLKVEVWKDINNNDIVDGGEYSVILDTRIARND